MTSINLAKLMDLYLDLGTGRVSYLCADVDQCPSQTALRTPAPGLEFGVFPSLRLVALPMLKRLVCSIILHIPWERRNEFIIFTNPSVRAGYDTRSIFKQSLTGLNSEFSFS